MPVRNLIDESLSYYLIAHHAKGQEREEENGKLLSLQLLDDCRSDRPTDIFIVSHGWMGDVPAAIRQYDKWAKAMHACSADQASLEKARPGFRPFIIGFHWPSLPWGDEELGSGSFSSQGPGGGLLEHWIARYANRIGDTPAARAALGTIFGAALEDIAPASLPAEVREAYLILDRESGMGSGGEAPGEDREPFDPDFVYEAAGDDDMVSYDAPWYGGILSPLRILSFWKMKNRARQFGEGSARALLDRLQEAAPDTARFHLIGHSFGCIVVASMIRGPSQSTPLGRPIHALVLLQGALSMWSFCSDLPHRPGTPGYFSDIVRSGHILGPILTTRSEHDIAVGSWYPIAAGIKHQLSYAPTNLPNGALGAYGARGSGFEVVDRTMMPVNRDYEFKPGVICNLDAADYICEGKGSSGAHNDIAKAEVAHAIWQAVQTPRS